MEENTNISIESKTNIFSEDVIVTIEWIRHAESCSNIVNFNPMHILTFLSHKCGMHPILTDNGISQSINLGKYIDKNNYDFIFSSPTIRTITTALISCNNKNNKIYIINSIKEDGNISSYIGMDKQNIPPKISNLKIMVYIIKKWLNKNGYNNLPTIDFSLYSESDINLSDFHKKIIPKIYLSGIIPKKNSYNIVCFSHGLILRTYFDLDTIFKDTAIILNKHNEINDKLNILHLKLEKLTNQHNNNYDKNNDVNDDTIEELTKSIDELNIEKLNIDKLSSSDKKQINTHVFNYITSVITSYIYYNEKRLLNTQAFSNIIKYTLNKYDNICSLRYADHNDSKLIINTSTYIPICTDDDIKIYNDKLNKFINLFYNRLIEKIDNNDDYNLFNELIDLSNDKNVLDLYNEYILSKNEL